MKRFLLHRERGLSLVELAVAMAVIGILGVLVWRWVVSTREPLQRPAMLAQLAEAQSAVEGFVLANSTMPCPASDAQGVQACGDADAVFLPWRTLGLGSQFNQIHYGVNRGGSMDLALNTATAPKLASPDLYIEFTGLAVPAHQTGLTPSAGVTSALANATSAIGRAKIPAAPCSTAWTGAPCCASMLPTPRRQVRCLRGMQRIPFPWLTSSCTPVRTTVLMATMPQAPILRGNSIFQAAPRPTISTI